MKIGVLALQGAFAEHIATLEKLKTRSNTRPPPSSTGGTGRVNYSRRGKHHHHQTDGAL
jgi:glutamine amidotransferase PdxT